MYFNTTHIPVLVVHYLYLYISHLLGLFLIVKGWLSTIYKSVAFNFYLTLTLYIIYAFGRCGEAITQYAQ